MRIETTDQENLEWVGEFIDRMHNFEATNGRPANRNEAQAISSQIDAEILAARN